MSYDIEANQPASLDNLEAAKRSDQGNILTTTTAMHALPDPFSNSMSHLFFNGADRRILLDEVTHLCQFGNNLVAVVGEEGVGKTSFLNQACFELAESALCCQLQASYGMSAESLLEQVLSQLELPFSKGATAGELIATLRHSIMEGGLHRVVVIIDEAHELDDGILSALISLLQGQQGHHLHILMGGDLNLVSRLDSFDMVDVIVYDVSLKPFSCKETKDYLDFKLSTAGYPSERLIEENDAQQVWKDSGGYPKKINDYASALLYQEDLLGDESEARAAGLPLVHMGLLVVLLAGLILALIYMGGEEQSVVPESEVKQVAPDNIAVDEPEPFVPVPAEANIPASNDSPSAESEPPSSDLSESVLPAAPVQDEVIPETTATTASEVISQPQTTPPSVSPVVVGTPVAQAEPESIPAVTEPPQELEQELEKPVAEVLAPSRQKTDSLQPIVSGPVKSVRDHTWLTSLDENAYVLQVLAASQRASVERFIAAQPNRDALKLLTLRRDSRPWYIVVIGSYASNESARRAINSLPQSQVNGGPWPRKVSDLKREIATNAGN